LDVDGIRVGLLGKFLEVEALAVGFEVAEDVRVFITFKPFISPVKLYWNISF